MSARARGIVLGTEDGRLVVEASDAEVAEFGRGDLIEAVRLERRPRAGFGIYAYGSDGILPWPSSHSPIGYSHTSSHAYSPAAPPRASGNAVLRTLCGAERWITVEDPPRPIVRVPMWRDVRFGDAGDDPVALSAHARDFEYRQTQCDRYGRMVHEYVERWRD